MITLQIEGQTLELPEDVAVSDDAIRRVIAPLFPQAANATIQRVTDGNGITTIKLTKQAGTKGTYATILDRLKRSEPHVNPAFTLYQQLHAASDPRRYKPEDVLTLQRRVKRAITQGEEELKATHDIVQRLRAAPGHATSVPPVGF
ncbi:MAG: hypothetical protein KGS09_18585 [Nitrospirae bacterium]|nr:hypothetical protein [Nitrospirota bacterium]MBU6482536.1 hypothetical protein [Nitrospirota bacterium]MDE3038984.1 hypothetical protein [Nitrospirota bacterium]MDE3220894.1 hypothetical protein [Nitrospirota bacterium]